ncbi:MAG: hypothetical protein HFF38_00285 [Lawsonibacter sp.]|nr:hypothetical protein [Lawsonibacter sp.]
MKKFINLLTSLCIVTSLCVPVAGAVSPVEEPVGNIEVINYSRYISDTDVEELKNGINATYTTSTGKVMPLDCVVTVEDVVINPTGTRSADGRTYAVTVAAEKKDESNSGSINDEKVAAKAYITMMWTDVEGIKNTIDRLYGGINVSRGTLRDGVVRYGNSHNRPMNRPSFSLGTSASFDKGVSYTSSSLTGSVHACYQSWFEEYSLSVLTVCVEPSIFD